MDLTNLIGKSSASPRDGKYNSLGEDPKAGFLSAAVSELQLRASSLVARTATADPEPAISGLRNELLRLDSTAAGLQRQNFD